MTDDQMLAIVFIILGSLAILWVTILAVFYSLSGQMSRVEGMNRDLERRLYDEMMRGEKRIYEETTRGEKRISDQITNFERRISDRVDRVDRRFSSPN